MEQTKNIVTIRCQSGVVDLYRIQDDAENSEHLAVEIHCGEVEVPDEWRPSTSST
jgi:hypothetical protein